jgi:osmoprotectant transport system substrate-binding protein
MRRTSALTGLTASLALVLSACGGGSEDPMEEGSGSDDGGGGGGSVVVGSANFSESALLAEIYAGALEANGMDVQTRLNIGSREVYIKAIEDGSIDVVPEYTGVLRDYFLAGEGGAEGGEASDAQGVYDELVEAVPEGLVVGDYSEAEDKDALVVTQETADEYDLQEIGDLSDVAGDLTLGGPPEWKTRSTGIPGLKDVYDVEFGSFTETDAGGPLTLKALTQGRVDAGNLFSTNPQIPANDLVVLEDPESLFGSQNIVPLLREEVATDEAVAVLDEVGGKLTTESLTDLVAQVDIDKEDPADVAEQWLSDNDLA